MAMNAVLTMRSARESGFAPHTVFVDSIASTSDATSRPFHDTISVWSYGDPDSGATWGYGSNPGTHSRNTSYGPCSGHCYKAAGTYLITLNQYDGSFIGYASRNITVTSADSAFSGTNTVCVRYDTTHDFTGAPAGAQQITQTNFQTIIDTYALDGFRVLFQEQDTWTASSTGVIDDNGTGYGRIIGKFGPSGSTKPRIIVPASGTAFIVSDADSPNLSKVTFMDLDIDGNSGSGSFGFLYFGSADDITFLRMYIHNLNNVGIDFGDANRVGDHIPVGLYIIDTEISFCGNNGCIGGAYENLVAGSYLHDCLNSSSHLYRNGSFNKLAIIYSDFAPGGGDCVTLRAIDYNSATNVWPINTISMYGYVGFNVMRGGNVGDSFTTVFSFRPVNNSFDMRIQDCIAEANYISTATSVVADCIRVSAREVTVRNNFLDMTASIGGVGVSSYRTGIEPVPRGINTYNNTIVTNGANSFIGVNYSSIVSNNAGANPNSIRGNLSYAPNVTSPVGVQDASGSATLSDNTTTPGTSNPNFPTFPWTTLVHAIPGTVTTGTSVPIFIDGFARSRNGETNQRGAYQATAGSTPWFTSIVNTRKRRPMIIMMT